MTKICIIGSGPSGAIAADYLINHSAFNVEMLDVGYSPEKFVAPTSSGFIPPKTLFGNAFMYQRFDKFKFFFDGKTEFNSSHAKGGLSNVWGANISSLHKKYLKNWGLDAFDFYEGFNYVLRRIPVLARSDMVDELYSIPISNKHTITSGISYDHTVFTASQKDELRKNNLFVGASKLALNPDTCTKCAKCMFGCAENSIFNASSLVDDLHQFHHFKYKPNFHVEKFEEKDGVVLVHAYNAIEKKLQIIEYDYLIIAAGVLDSSIIVNRSLSPDNKIINFKESKKYYLPFFSTKLFSASNLASNISLSHIVIQNLEGKSMTHCQLYPLFHVLEYILVSKFGKYSALILTPFKFFLKYFYLGMVYLDSEDSGDLKVELGDEKITITGNESSKSNKRLNIFLEKVRQSFSILKLVPIRLTLSSKLGHSQHFGGSLPMTKDPKFNSQTDMLGRPFMQRRTFVVDTSVLPTIPSVPTTINVMANSVRISKSIIDLTSKAIH
jgi:NAD-dependent dihydropyrimidine dehydrogenase PreA subunit